MNLIDSSFPNFNGAKELFCKKIQRMSFIGQSLKLKNTMKKAQEEDQKILRRNHILWNKFLNNIHSEMKRVALEGEYEYLIPLEFFPIHEKIAQWGIKNGFKVDIQTDKQIGGLYLNEYLSNLPVDKVLAKDIYFTMKFIWSPVVEESING
jgi:hypothetical protein